ncbi:GntR family transcriptional repressor for pyruvate dehydrogenase complex [Rhodoferax ferrireducens]|uniref:GntR family transcriptional repressor for pyruvate dehydrogenase complex n=1 Tax=Rhodoferax ferrireducens TaxID=192843 RepID=A0ABU2CFE9_9BURK|nr:FadR/GntR family transcriptional regulator [Rhodoferax ferrireducens]MDR7380066.1 GntR family transcriptional repressor for pyruvate dehydrogenase complex [Rhodoferax ferrireducens]
MDSPFPLDQMPALRVGARLSEQLADALAVSIREGQLPVGQRLPTEGMLVERFGVSRTVVREALSRLKMLGLIESRQGSGAFVMRREASTLAPLVLAPDGSIDAVIQMVEVRRALEAESAALAAARRSKQDIQQIKATIQTLERAVASGGDGVAEDVAFHTAIATAARNPFLLATLAYLNQFLLDATRVTRANEATRADFAQQVRDEHALIVQAIEDGDSAAARLAGATHMVNAARRIGSADPVFWNAQGKQLAERLLGELVVPHTASPAAAAQRPRPPR